MAIKKTIKEAKIEPAEVDGSSPHILGLEDCKGNEPAKKRQKITDY